MSNTTRKERQQTIEVQGLDLHGTKVRMQEAVAQQLDTFLALSPEQRAAHWRQLTDEQRRRLIQEQLIRSYDDWSEASIDTWIAKCDAKWGAEPTATEAAVLGALESLEADAQRAVYHAVKEVKHFEMEANAYKRAREMFQRGLRLTQLDDGSWSVPSAEQAGQTYSVTRGGVCSCQAGAKGTHCKHVAFVAAWETAIDNLSAHDDYDPEPEYAAAAAALGQRLAETRARYTQAA